MNSHLLPLFISYRSSGEKLINIQQIHCVIMCIILMITLFYKALILQEEIWCWSLSGLKGLKGLCHEDIAFVVYFCVYTSLLCTHHPCTKCSWRVMKKISNNFHQQALTVIIYLVNFACIALKLENVSPTTMYCKFQSMSTFAICCCSNRVFTCFQPPNWHFPLSGSHKTFHFSYMKFLCLLKFLFIKV